MDYVTDLREHTPPALCLSELEGIADMAGVPHDFAYSTGYLDAIRLT